MKEFTTWWSLLSWSDATFWTMCMALFAWGVAWGVLQYRRFAREMDAHDLAMRARADQPPAFTARKRY
jgi:hypothetical protein